MIADFHFLRPAWLLLLLPLILLWWRLLRAGHERGSWRGAIDRRLLPFVLSDRDGGQHAWMRRIFAAAALLAILALAGPTWEQLPRPVYLKQSALIIALDLSRSMDAADIKPSRLARARHKIADILNLRSEGQTALVVYAADAFTVTPLTSDTDTILALLPALDSSMMPAQGSRADRALELAIELFENSGVARGDLLLISDSLGDGELQRIEAELARRGAHRLSVLAIGTADGGPIPLADGGFLKDRDGAIVIAEMQEQNLRRAASLGGGVYATISSDDIDINTLAYVLESDIDERALREAEYSADLWRELGPWLLLAALPCAALAFRRGLIWTLPLLLLVAPPRDAFALDWQSWWLNDDQRARELFERGEHAAAAQLFGDPGWRASSRYRAGDYETALEAWQAQETESALYNRGNALARLGRMEEALSVYERLLRDNPSHADALHNKRAIEAFLEQQQRQQQQGQRQDGESGADSQAEQQQDGKPGADGEGEQQQDGQAQQNQEPAQSARDSSQGLGEQGQDRQQAQDAEAQGSDEQAAGADAAESDAARQPAQAAENRPRESSEGDSEAEAPASVDEKMSMQAAQQWLRKIPDDPGGLLRRKFLYQYRQRGGGDAEGQAW